MAGIVRSVKKAAKTGAKAIVDPFSAAMDVVSDVTGDGGAPGALPEPVTAESSDAQMAEEQRRKQRLARQGRAATILTSPYGVQQQQVRAARLLGG